jgi:hypothetical protein
MSKQVQLESERSGKSCEISSLKVKAAAEDYDRAKPNLEYTWGWKAFFGEGHWAKRDSWPWKSGREPTPIDKPRLTAKQKLDKQLEEEGIKIQ